MKMPQTSPKTSIDAFHYGRFFAVQPVATGHRAGQDALFLAACLPASAKGRLVDLGSGAGVAGLAGATLNPALEVTLVEIDPVMAELARQSIELKQNSHLAKRTKVICADVTLKGRARVDAGLADNAYDWALMNPPYNHAGQRRSPDARKSLAHAIGDTGFEPWARTAAAILKPGGTLIMIYRCELLAELLSALGERFGQIRILPVHSKAEENAKRVILIAKAGAKAPLTILPPLVVHGPDGKFTPRAAAVFAGTGRLFDEAG